MGALNTPRLQLKPPTPASVEQLSRAEPSLAGATLSPPARAWLEALPKVDPRTGGAWLICRRTAPKMIGLFAYQDRFSEDAIEISYMILSRWRGRGFGFEAVQAACGCLVHQLQATRLLADVAVGNQASERILKRLGFVAMDEAGLTVGGEGFPAQRWIYIASAKPPKSDAGSSPPLERGRGRPTRAAPIKIDVGAEGSSDT